MEKRLLGSASDDISLGTGDKDVSGTKTEGRSLSQFARVNYAYDDRYLLEASIRRDGYDNLVQRIGLVCFLRLLLVGMWEKRAL